MGWNQNEALIGDAVSQTIRLEMTTRDDLSGKRNAIINFLSTNFTPFCQNAKCQKLLVMFSTFMPITHSSSKVWTNFNFDVYFIFSDGQSFLDRPKSR